MGTGTGTDGGDVDRSESGDIDPEDLQRRLSHIEEAVGLKEEYGSEVETWLVFGVLVALASALSQYVYTAELTGAYYAVIWLGLFGGGFALYSYVDRVEGATGPDRRGPSINVIVFVTYLASWPVLAVLGQFTGDMGSREWSLATLAVIVVLLGAAYVVSGYVLRAQRVRDRDRYPFYVGGVGLVALGVAMPRVEVLVEWPYAAFGGGYFFFALATYAYLSGTAE